MNVLLIEPFFGGSHQQWATGLQKHSGLDIQFLTLPDRHWKWRMHGGAVKLAQYFLEQNYTADLILASDMLDLPSFLGLTRKKTAHTPVALYFHENQITYPWSPEDQDVRLKRENQYGYINFRSALAADRIAFNSHFHKKSFLDALPSFLRQFPDYRSANLVDHIAEKSEVLYLGMELQNTVNNPAPTPEKTAVLLWNHRWEYDKNPEGFFRLCYRLKARGYAFKLIVLGEAFRQVPAIFAEAKEKLADHILHFGFAEKKESYYQLLQAADILPVTAVQDFFGGSVVEAIYAGCHPILPNRLAYPEHIPASLKDVCLYDTEEELFEYTCRAIESIQQIRNSSEITKNFVARYDWPNLITDYDNFFDQMINAK